MIMVECAKNFCASLSERQSYRSPYNVRSPAIASCRHCFVHAIAPEFHVGYENGLPVTEAEREAAKA